jgi:hypothetical protein
MSDIYKLKAEKYKYKYYKLKKQLKGGGGSNDCVSIPPKLLEGLNITQSYPLSSVDEFDFEDQEDFYMKSPGMGMNMGMDKVINDLKQFNTNDYVGKLMSKDDYDKEINNFSFLEDIKWGWNRYEYIKKIYYAGYINYNDFIIHLKTNNLLKLKDCVQLKDNQKDKIYYLISNNVGQSFNNLSSEIIQNNIIDILKSIKKGTSYIQNLMQYEYVLGNIKKENMTYNVDKKQVYFINYDNKHNPNECDWERRKAYSLNNNYSLLTSIFYYKYNNKDEINLTGKQFIETMRDFKNIGIMNNRKLNYLRSLTESFDEIYNQYITDLFGNLHTVISDYNLKYEDRGQVTKTTLKLIYNTYIKPIELKSDIYALSLFIYEIIPNKTDLLKQLLVNAIRNSFFNFVGLENNLLRIINEQENLQKQQFELQKTQSQQAQLQQAQLQQAQNMYKNMYKQQQPQKQPQPQQQQQQQQQPQKQPQPQQQQQQQQQPQKQPQPQQQQQPQQRQRQIQQSQQTNNLETCNNLYTEITDLNTRYNKECSSHV